MFIELTDHLRCPQDHQEAYLILLPGPMRGRQVREGHLSCPLCGRTWEVREGVAEFGAGESGSPETQLTPEAVQAFLGLGGPGGYVGLVGTPAGLAPQVARLLAGVHLVAVNPPAALEPDSAVSVLRAPRLPLRSSSMRGVVLGAGLGDWWVTEAIRVTLPGLRVVGEGEPPSGRDLDLLARAPGVWVGKRPTAG